MVTDRRMRVAWWTAIMVALLRCAAIGQTQLAPVASQPSEAVLDQDPSALLQSSDPNISQNSRELAAMKVAARHRDRDRRVLSALLAYGSRDQKLAVARGLAAVAWPDRDFIAPLTMLLNGADSSAIATAAAEGLAQYRDDPSNGPDVLQSLIVETRKLSQNPQNTLAPAQRQIELLEPVIRAIGMFKDKQAAQTLLDLQEHDENTQIQADAGDALIDMTGIETLDHDSQRWAQWFAQYAQTSDADFQDAIIHSRGLAFERLLAERNRLASAATDQLYAQYWTISPEGQPALLMEYLRSPAPAIRALGTKLVLALAQSPVGAPAGAIVETRRLLSDPSETVRAAAAHALSADVNSANAMIARLAEETDDAVRIELIHSLAPWQNPRAISAMLQILSPENSPLVLAEAAGAISQGGEAFSKDPALKARAVTALNAALGFAAGDDHVLAQIEAAMAAVKDDSFAPVFQRMLNPPEPLEVRANALRGLGSLPNAAPYEESIAGYLSDASPQLRLAAVEALGMVSQPIDPYVGPLLDRMTNDPSPTVRAEIWTVLNNFADAPHTDERVLVDLADRLKELTQPQPAKELEIRKQLRNRMEDDLRKPALPDADRHKIAEDEAAQQQDIADLMMNSAVDLPDQAQTQYQAALDYWRSNGGSTVVIDRLSTNVVRAALAAKHWTEAATFASGVIRNFGDHSPVAGNVSDQFVIAAQNMENSTDPGAFGDADQFFAAVEKMSPPLPDEITGRLNTAKAAIDQKRAATSSPPARAP